MTPESPDPVPTVDAHGAKGVQVGHHNIQQNIFHPPPRPKPRWQQRFVLALMFASSLALFAAAAYAQWRGAEVTAVWIVAAVTAIGATLLARWTTGTSRGDDQVMAYPGRGVAARHHLIELTDRLWVRGALHHSLQTVVRLEVGLGDQPDAVKDPYGTGQLQDLADGQRLPAGTRLRSMLDERSGSRLLVIGEPGSGKTTHLLDLAEDQLAKARADETAPVPLVLLLSTWAGAPGGLAAWVCAEARQRYTIDATDMMTWLQAGQVLLLLDGLDEVADRWREACLADVEAFCADTRFSSCGLVITCRTREFRAFDRKVPVTRAVRVLPLSDDQVQQAFASGGPSLTALREAAMQDRVLAELLTTPLMLGVAVLAFARLEPGARLPAGDHRQLLFGLYVRRMLDRVRALRDSADQPGPTRPPKPGETYYHLVWLARLMTRQGQTIFYPDLLTPAWLPDRSPPWPLTRQHGPISGIARRLGWDHTSTGLVGGRLAALVGALSGAPLGALATGIPGAAIAAVAAALALGGGVALTFGVLFQSPVFERLFTPVVGHDTYNIYAASSWTWSWRKASRGLITWLLFGGIVGASLAVAGTSLAVALAVAAVLGLGGVLSGGTVPNHEKPPAAPGGAFDASLRRLAYLPHHPAHRGARRRRNTGSSTRAVECTHRRPADHSGLYANGRARPRLAATPSRVLRRPCIATATPRPDAPDAAW